MTVSAPGGGGGADHLDSFIQFFPCRDSSQGSLHAGHGVKRVKLDQAQGFLGEGGAVLRSECKSSLLAEDSGGGRAEGLLAHLPGTKRTEAWPSVLELKVLLLHADCVAWDKFLNLSEPQFSHHQKEGGDVGLPVWLWR